MENIRIAQLKIKKYAYLEAARLVELMNKYSYNYRTSERNALKKYALMTQGLPLPSGRWGNAIALALEINDYVSAKLLIENADELGLETESIVSDIDYKNPWTLKDEYLYSQLTYNEEMADCAYFRTPESYLKYTKAFQRNARANRELENILGVTQEDKNILVKVPKK